jgi:pre-mRNA-splicing factor CWC22
MVHRLEQAKLRNLACFFAHLLYTDALEWKVMECIHLTEDLTTSSSRIFVKILMQEIANNMGITVFAKKMQESRIEALFPTDSVDNARFSINFFTSIGLGAVTDELREFLKDAPKLLLQKKYKELLQ